VSAAATTPAAARQTGRHRAAEFRAQHRGGGLFTETINQRVGAVAAVIAERAGAPPTILTLTNLVIGVGTSIAVAALAPALSDGRIPAMPVGLVALVLWQLAYSLDCADGQLARVTGQGSPAGARIDVLCDVASQIALVAAVSAVAHAYRPHLPIWFIAVFAAGWMINLVASVLQQGATGASLVTSGNPVIRVIKLVRDYGAMITAIALVIALVPRWTGWLMLAFTAVNLLFLAASIASSARESLRLAAAARAQDRA
jgi:phosphatidylglycerophosphate synthase